MANLTFVDRNVCVAAIHDVRSPYGYFPSKAAGIAFLALFGLSLLGHVGVSIRYKIWWQLVFPIGALCEIVGWIGRTWSSSCPYETTPFIMQITTLILAPTFFTAGIYIVLGQLIQTFGRQVSPLSPSMYLFIFCTVDAVSLIVQAIGGAFAATAYQKTPMGNTSLGTHIMLAGITFQLASLIVFSFLFTKVMVKTFKLPGKLLHARKTQMVVGATIISVLVVVIRSIYRSIELAQGWTGYLITHEVYFLVLDGALMVAAVGVYNFCQPMWARVEGWKDTDETEMTEVENASASVLSSK